MLYAITGPIAAGKSTFTKNFSEYTEIKSFDLDLIAKNFLNQQKEIHVWLAHHGCSKDNLTNDIWEKILTDENLYKEYCLLYEPHLIKFVKSQKAIYDHIIFETSALFSYPELMKLFDVIIIKQELYKERLQRCEQRYGSYEKMEIADTIFYSKQKEVKDIINDYIINNALFTVSDNSLEFMKTFVKKQGFQKEDRVDVALFCGSFNPWTIGHQDILDKAKAMFRNVKVVQAINPDKVSERVEDFDRCPYIPDYIRMIKKSVVLIRGVRNSKDVEESMEWHRNIELCLGYEVPLVLIRSSKELEGVSSTFVRNLQKLSPKDAEKFLVKK
jgi:pantetheine-phosphate adenylyltransferase